ncbi:hypothetical protein, partial [Flavobacterium sp.]|uniref:hypothetical protein n=1 Tax=Flavobacterium sp. TaxID=239 RepID=UPI002FDCAB53
LLLAAFGALLWTDLGRKPKSYDKLDWFLRNLLRYFIIIIAFLYGTIKLFAMQMPEPGLSQLATPLGDYLPMRLSWMFFGYSSPYQIFSGVMEVIVALLLLYRRTIPTGLLLGFGVFLNVFILNLCFDIPVKLFSMHLVIYCLYLIIIDAPHYLNFLWRNQPVGRLTSFDISLTKKLWKIARVAVKILVVLLFGGLSLYQSWAWREEFYQTNIQKPITPGIYYVTSFKKNNTEIPISLANDTIWKDFIFQDNGRGSIMTTDTLLTQNYNRGYFSYTVKPKEKTIVFSPSGNTDKVLFKLQYQQTGAKTMQLYGKIEHDSVVFNLVKSDRKFQLAEKQFHWISEANR